MGLLETAFSAESLHTSFMEIRRDIHFKYDVQNYRINEIKEINKFRKAYANGTFEFSEGKPFTIRERGKARYIRPDVFRDRVVIHAFCKYVLLEKLKPYFIYDNHASLEGRGIDKQIERTCVFLNKYYSEYHTNEGYILKVDIKNILIILDMKKL